MTPKEAAQQRIRELQNQAAINDHRLGSKAAAPNQELLAEIRRLQLEIAHIEDRERSAAETLSRDSRAEERRRETDEAAFWFRRFFTTLGIANGAAFAALASGLLQADEPVKLAPVVGPAMDAFIWGALWAGSIPLWMWARLRLRIYSSGGELRPPIRGAVVGAGSMFGQLIMISAAASVVLFCLGLFTATGAVHGLAGGKKVADARVAAESKARAHPIIPSALAPKPAK